MTACGSSTSPAPATDVRVRQICAIASSSLADLAGRQNRIATDLGARKITPATAIKRFRDGYRSLAGVTAEIAADIDSVTRAAESRSRMAFLVRAYTDLSKSARATAAQVRAGNARRFDRARERFNASVRKLPAASRRALGSDFCGGAGKS